MKFATSKEHRDFFHRQNWIEFADLLATDQLASVKRAIDDTLAKRLHIETKQLPNASSEKLYLQGHDIWRSHPSLHKFVTQTHLATIAAELCEKKKLRLGYDQFFPDSTRKMQKDDDQTYSRFLAKKNSLQNISCMTDVACGLVIALNDEIPQEEVTSLEGDIFPQKSNHISFFTPNLPIQWDFLAAHTGQSFYMIVFTDSTSHYQLQPQDPHTHSLKRLGYVFNDRLSDKLNPIVYRQ